MFSSDSKLTFVNEFIEQASKLLPGIQTRDELQKSLNVVAQAALAKLDLVTREEFEAQKEVLRNTRARVTELEAQLQVISDELEHR